MTDTHKKAVNDMFPHTVRRQKAPQRRRIMFVVARKDVFFESVQ